MLSLIRPSKIIIFTLLSIGLACCTKSQHQGLPAKRQANSPYTMPAEAYLAMAKNQVGEEQQSLLLMAAGRYIEEGRLPQASQVLQQTNNTSALQQDEKNILLAKIDLTNDKAQSSISKLAEVKNRQQLPLFYQALYHELLAGAYEQSQQFSYALNERLQLENLLQDEGNLERNRKQIWLSLTRLPTAELNTLSMESDNNPLLQGWIDLALIAKQGQGGQQSLLSRLEGWQRTYPRHPANHLLPSSMASAAPYLYQNPRKIALLLPLSGPLSGPGNAIRDGIISAYHQDPAAREIELKAYDTAAANAGQLYQQAINEGAEFVIGPLTKADVTQVAVQEHPIPTLLLNDANNTRATNSYYFGLSPSNEARQIALQASRKGLRRALVIAPANPWGDEIAAAFNEQFKQYGGMMVERLAYDDNTNLEHAVRDLMRVSESQARAPQFHANKAKGVEQTKPKRREDFDMIFLLGYPSQARQIMPLLRYYFIGNTPVYATSTVYSGNTSVMRDKDLDGIIFCDMPWVFSHQLANRNWPEQLNSYNRLYALGMDSYALAGQLNQLILFPALGLNNNTGVLYLNQVQQIARILAWGQFKNGVATLIHERA